jgi:hypothetical protein
MSDEQPKNMEDMKRFAEELNAKMKSLDSTDQLVEGKSEYASMSDNEDCSARWRTTSTRWAGTSTARCGASSWTTPPARNT